MTETATVTGPDSDDVNRTILIALDEDLRYGPDITSWATVPADARATATCGARAAGVVAGIEIARRVFDEVIGAGNYAMDVKTGDGERVEKGSPVFTVEAPTRAMLTAERTMLNLLCHMSGIATATAQWVDAVAGTSCKIRDSRKTLPGLRAIEKYAVRLGGGVNHRMGLGDEALIKDNHVIAAGGVVNALRAVREAWPGIRCEVEVDRLSQLEPLFAEGADLILLDNMDVNETAEAVKLRDKLSPRTLLESSGGLSLDVAAAYARTGVNFLAVGSLTHSVKVLDLGLDM